MSHAQPAALGFAEDVSASELPTVERLNRLRRNRLVGYSAAVAAVAIATALRVGLSKYVMQGIPFITYFPAIVFATLLGGFWPGVLAALMSGFLAWVLFIPPEYSFLVPKQDQTLALLLFFLIAALLIALVTALNAALDRLLVKEKTLHIEIEKRRRSELDALRLAAIVETSDDAIVTKDLSGIITTWNKGAERLFGYTAAEVIGKPIYILIPSERQDEEPEILQRLRRGEHIDHYETVRMRKDGRLIDVSLSVSPLISSEGKIIGASKIARDITERKHAEAAQEMLMKEMSHRLKNAFAVVNGIVGLSAGSCLTPEALAQKIRERLEALALAHDLTRPGLVGAETRSPPPTTLHSVTRAIFAPYLEPSTSLERRLFIDGIDLQVAQNSMTSLALLLHEFATNAVKYGSLSVPHGSIEVAYQLEDGKVLVTWQEKGGPLLDGPPDQQGFGSTLARQIVSGHFGGKLSYSWNKDGLIIRVAVLKERLAAGVEERLH